MDAFYRRGPGPVGARRCVASATPRCSGHGGQRRRCRSRGRRGSRREAGQGKGLDSMPREIITIECTEARKEGKSPSRYTTTRNKKTQTEKLEIKKYNPALRRHTLHREVK